MGTWFHSDQSETWLIYLLAAGRVVHLQCITSDSTTVLFPLVNLYPFHFVFSFSSLPATFAFYLSPLYPVIFFSFSSSLSRAFSLFVIFPEWSIIRSLSFSTGPFVPRYEYFCL